MLKALENGSGSAIEAATRRIGRELLGASSGGPMPLGPSWVSDQLMDWTTRHDSLRTKLFRFVDVLPMLTDDGDAADHLRQMLAEEGDQFPFWARWPLRAARGGKVTDHLLARSARMAVAAHARRFIAGSTTKEVLGAIRRERRHGCAFTLDVLGEAVTSDAEAERYLATYLELMERVAPKVNGWAERAAIDRDENRRLPRMNVSVKLSSLDSQFDALDREGSFRRVSAALGSLLRAARRERGFVNVDMESYAYKDLTLEVFERLLMEEEFRHTADVGIVVQCYLKDAEDDLQRLLEWVRRRGTPIWVRLVKGAYWDYETAHAAALGWPVPVYTEKSDSDAAYESCTRFLMEHSTELRPALASHNVRSIAHAIAVAESHGMDPRDYEFQVLYGMADGTRSALVERGHRVRVYMPYGELLPGMAYLVRRLLENTANESFVRVSSREEVDPDALLANPASRNGHSRPHHGAADIETTAVAGDDTGERLAGFRNEPLTDFSRAEAREAMVDSLSAVRERFGETYPLSVNGKRVETEETMTSICPSHASDVVGVSAVATVEDADRAVKAAAAAWDAWSETPVAARADMLRRAADTLAKRRHELSAWIIHESGKGWREADADVAEAIDFCRYYAAGAEELSRTRGIDVPGEANRFDYLPRGVTAVIAPWNFPLAILTGMTTAALVTGNPVVIKPAEQAPVIAFHLVEILHAAGVPRDVLHYLPGRGEVVGARLVDHPVVAVIAFTGSRAVGLGIHRRAAELAAAGGRTIKHVIAEMGGKNAIVVDEDADLDEAVLGVVQSAFGFQGQKCSACSRAIVVDAVYEAFLGRLVEAARSLSLGPAEDPASRVGPVIDAEARARIEKYLAIGREEGRPALERDAGALAEEGYYVGPHIFADVPSDARIAQEEIFGPVVAVMRAKDIEDAIRIANDTDYGLTGGIYSRNPAHISLAQRRVRVGNFYVNRPITGALVARQPFGGFKMSGFGTKAGGADYLREFVVPRTVTENTMRRGFSPPPELIEPNGLDVRVETEPRS